MNFVSQMRTPKPVDKKTSLPKNKGMILETFTIAPAPSRDYYGLQLFQKHLSWLKWKVSHGPYLLPQQRNIALDDFMKDSAMQNELAFIFGADIANLTVDVAKGRWNLSSMPATVLYKIAGYLTVPELLSLSQVNKRLSKECSKNEIWEAICKDQWKILLHDDIERAESVGWKRVYMEKMMPAQFFTQKIFLSNLVKNAKLKPSLQIRDTALNSYLDREKSRLPSSKSNSILIGSEVVKTPSTTSRSISTHFFKSGKNSLSESGKLSDRSVLANKSKTTNRKLIPPLSSTDNYKKTSNTHYEGYSVKNFPLNPSSNPYNKFYPSEMFHTSKVAHSVRPNEESRGAKNPPLNKVRSINNQPSIKKPSTAATSRSLTKTSESIQNYRVKSNKLRAG